MKWDFRYRILVFSPSAYQITRSRFFWRRRAIRATIGGCPRLQKRRSDHRQESTYFGLRSYRVGLHFDRYVHGSCSSFGDRYVRAANNFSLTKLTANLCCFRHERAQIGDGCLIWRFNIENNAWTIGEWIYRMRCKVSRRSAWHYDRLHRIRSDNIAGHQGIELRYRKIRNFKR